MMKLDGFFGKKICVAVSGGVDSVCLLHYMKSQEKPYGYHLCAVHCEHGIRGEESLLDARFVEELCKEWDIPLYTFSADCPTRAEREKVSLETAARNFRKEIFKGLIEEKTADYIATAHHKNDEAETVLFRLARGTSLSGVGGMSAMNGYMIRPFLDMTRGEIEEYALKNGLTHREDSTNKERDATRNKLRLDVLPALENAVPGAIGGLVRFAEKAKEDDEFLYAMAKELVTEKDGGVLVEFSNQKPLFSRACMLALKRVGIFHDYTSVHLERAWALQSLQLGAKQTMLKGVEAKKTEKGIFFYLPSETEKEGKGVEQPFVLGTFDGGRYEVNVNTSPTSEAGVLRIDGDELPANSVFRFRKEGDFIRCFGGGTKSLKKFFNEKKVPKEDREYIPLIAEKNGSEVYVVCGVEIADSVKVTEKTKRVYFIKTTR
ncbi:MAG: tRNA lysidine(34) synthetase TilS [Clostridiales bacterium]|nr:tRNA lysidine(34) synthetase TilS [Clostridiales bacterium]